VAGTPAAKPVKGPLTREAAIEKLDAAGMFDSHTMNDVYDNLRSRMGPYAVTILDRFVHGADEEAVIKSLGFQKSDRPRALRKLEDGKEQIAGVLREHLGEGNQTDRVLLRMLEVILNTERARQNPMYLSNASWRKTLQRMAATDAGRRGTRRGLTT
jgi:hypothetical protein